MKHPKMPSNIVLSIFCKNFAQLKIGKIFLEYNAIHIPGRRRMIGKLKNYDFTLLTTPLFLTAFGIVMIYSATMVSAVVEGHESTYYMVRQIQWFGVSLIGFLFCSIFPY